MNIFKVLASGNKSFQEETASAILAWLLSPSLEHGLGYNFIQKFLEVVSIPTDNKKLLSELSDEFVPRLRYEEETKQTLWIDLEYNVDKAFIDIVIGIENWIFAIENKIYTHSVKSGQLSREYTGLKQKIPNIGIGIIYLVPIPENSEILDAKTLNEFDELHVKSSDFKALITWQKNEIGNIPSIADIIEKILEDESKGKIDPIPEYTRHTLKALNSFISNDFSGYEYEKKNIYSGKVNPLTEETLSLNEIKPLDDGCVGVKNRISGLLRMSKEDINNKKFQYTSQDMLHKNHWIGIKKFKSICKWIIDGSLEEIEWDDNLSSKLLYRIAKDYKDKVFIGIKGGKDALEGMEAEVLKTKKWNISICQPNPQWISGELYYKILKEKGINENYI
jgi:hypothetical protein